MNGVNYNLLSNLCNDELMEFMRYLLAKMHLATFFSFIFISFITYLVDSHALRRCRQRERQGQLTNKCKMILSIAF